MFDAAIPDGMHDDELRTFDFGYEHAGLPWSFHLKASSPEDARERIKKIASAELRGEVMAGISWCPKCGHTEDVKP